MDWFKRLLYEARRRREGIDILAIKERVREAFKEARRRRWAMMAARKTW